MSEKQMIGVLFIRTCGGIPYRFIHQTPREREKAASGAEPKIKPKLYVWGQGGAIPRTVQVL